MTKAEQEWSLIEALNYCKAKRLSNKCCAGCPYAGAGCAIDATIAKLRAQEPRLLRLDEIKMLGMMWLESRNGFVQPVICQNYEYGVDRSVEFIMVHGTICNSINTFGKLWRVWTSEPCKEQREAAKWND